MTRALGHTEAIFLRVRPELRAAIEAAAEAAGLTVSDWLREVAEKAALRAARRRA